MILSALSALSDINFLSMLRTLAAYYFGANTAITLVAVAVVWTYRRIDMTPGSARFWAIFICAGLVVGSPLIVLLLVIIIKEFILLVVWPWWRDLEWPAPEYWPPKW